VKDVFRRIDWVKVAKKAGMEQLVVLIDDLNRYLPDTAIETLEAVRLQSGFPVKIREATVRAPMAWRASR